MTRRRCSPRLPKFGWTFRSAKIGVKQLYLIIGCRVSIPWGDLEFGQVHLQDVDSNTWIEQWTNDLQPAPPLVALTPSALATFLSPGGVTPRSPLPRAPWHGPYTYGHLPFTATTGNNDTCYRFEAYPTSRRITLATGDVVANTYASPASEEKFIPTGCSSVGRCALPSLLPHCTRYELHMPPGYTYHCGAAVPLYGQAGGGVEVMFPTAFKTQTIPIHPPIILSAL
jgi:hypothetical protein